jgi:integrase
MAKILSAFSDFFSKPIDELTKKEIEQWRLQRQGEGSKAATINRLMTALKAALNWGLNYEYIESNPLSRLKPLQERDSDKKTRYLSDDERTRLLSALDEHEARLRADYLKPLVILAMNTGIRKGDILSLTWGDVDFATRVISFIPGKTDSSADILHVSMNKTVTDTLTLWREQSADASPGALIFPSTKKMGAQLMSIKRAWNAVLKAADINGFRWHDMRHDFASRLVSQGVPLNDVRDLLGHADLRMTLRYAHLAPENKLKAVELLDAVK